MNLDVARERFDGRYDIVETGCWLWRKFSKASAGYGFAVLVEGQQISPHRLSYTIFKGPIPEGLTIDHLCRVRNCVNPDHLEAVTSAENVRRGISPSARNARKTHCLNGHEFTPENTYWHPQGGKLGRECLACRNARTAALGRGTWNVRKTHCKHGHEFTEENTMRDEHGHRRCRVCAREKWRRRRLARKRLVA